MVTFVYLIFAFCLSNFCMELRTSAVGWLHDSILSPPSFLSTFCKELRTSSVGWLHCSILRSFAFFFEHFLQGTMDLRHRLITPPTKTPHEQFTNCLRTFNIFYLPPHTPIRRVPGGGSEGGTGWPISYGLSPPLPHREKIRRGQNCCLHFLNAPLAYTLRKGWWLYNTIGYYLEIWTATPFQVSFESDVYMPYPPERATLTC